MTGPEARALHNIQTGRPVLGDAPRNGHPVVPPSSPLPEHWLLEGVSLSIRDAEFRGSYMKDGVHFGVQCAIPSGTGFLVKSLGLNLFKQEVQVFSRHPIRWALQRLGKFYKGERIDYSYNPTKVRAITAMARAFMAWIDSVKEPQQERKC